MAESQNAKRHYIVAENEMTAMVEHFYAVDQEDAVRQFIERTGYSPEAFLDYEIFVVLASDITPWTVEEEMPEPKFSFKKGKKGAL